MKDRFDALLGEHRLVAILRGIPDVCVLPLVESLVAGGLRLVEVTLSSDGVVAQIERLREALPDNIMVGAGTVTSDYYRAG